MNKLKVVFLGEKTDYWYYSNQAIKSRLAEIADVSWYGFPNQVSIPSHIPPFKGYDEEYKTEKNALKIIGGEKPDVMLITDRAQILAKNYWKNLDRVKIPKVQYAGDPHSDTPFIFNFCHLNKIDMILLQYYEGIASKYKLEFPNCIIGHLPWCVDVRLFKDYELERTIDFLCIGHDDKYYPFRHLIWKYIKHKHFNFYDVDRTKDWLGRDEYIEKINQSKIFPFGISIYKYPLAKFLEAWACKNLVMANKPIDGKRLHFIPNKNFVSINPKNYREKLEYYLRNVEERQKIIDEGYKTVIKYHTAKIRAKQLVDYFKMIIGEKENEKKS